MSDGYQVHLTEASSFDHDSVRVLIRERHGRYVRMLMADGTWQDAELGATTLDRLGILIPIEALDPLVAAIDRHLGRASHAETETRVLREWLASERARVEALTLALQAAVDALTIHPS